MISQEPQLEKYKEELYLLTFFLKTNEFLYQINPFNKENRKFQVILFFMSRDISIFIFMRIRFLHFCKLNNFQILLPQNFTDFGGKIFITKIKIGIHNGNA